MNLHRKDDIERALKPFKEYQEENDKKWEALHKRMKFDSIIQNKEKDILLWMNEAFEQNRAKTKEDLKEVIRNKVLRDVLKERDAKNDGGSSGVRLSSCWRFVRWVTKMNGEESFQYLICVLYRDL